MSFFVSLMIEEINKQNVNIVVEQSYKYINYCACGFLSIMVCTSCLTLFCQTYSRAVSDLSSCFLVLKQVSECNSSYGGSWGTELPSADLQFIFPIPFSKQYQDYLSSYLSNHLPVCLLQAVLLWPMVTLIPFSTVSST